MRSWLLEPCIKTNRADGVALTTPSAHQLMVKATTAASGRTTLYRLSSRGREWLVLGAVIT